MNVVFMGTPEIAATCLSALFSSAHTVTAVVTQPDKPAGRNYTLTPPPVKVLAASHGVPVVQPEKIRTPEFEAWLKAQAPDIIVVVAYGKILPKFVLDTPRYGCINLHVSLLPRWRGAAPIQRSILEGDERTGVSIMRVAHELDAGAWCRQASVQIGEKDAATLTAELAQLGAEELVGALPELAAHEETWHEQDESQVTFAAKIKKAEMRLDPADPASANARRVQAAGDTAPARTAVAGRGVRVMAARVAADLLVPQGGVVVEHGRVGLGCSDGTLELLRVKPDGKREMEASAWAAGLRGELSWERI